MTGAAEPAAEFHVQALGSTFVVTGASACEVAALSAQWSRLSATNRAEGRRIPIDLRTTPANQQGRVLLSRLTIQAIENAAGTRLMLHSAGVADADGRVVALAGPSGMGKTTAASYLGRHGFGYVTDETVSIGSDGTVLPFGRPLSVRRPRGEVQLSPDELGLASAPANLYVGRIVVLDRLPGYSGTPHLTAVSLVDSLLELIPHASALARLPDPLQLMARTVDRCGGVLRLTYGDLDDRIVSLVRQALDGETGAPEPWYAFPRAEPAVLDGAQRRLYQGTVTDGVVAAGEALVLVDQVPVRLSRIGLTIWDAARDGVSPENIVSMVEADHGGHPDALPIVRNAVTQMVQAGVLVDTVDQRPVVSNLPR